MAGSTSGPKHRGAAGYYDHSNHWRVDVAVLPDEQRVMPETVPHSWVGRHERACRCDLCQRYPAAGLKMARAQLLRSSARRRA